MSNRFFIAALPRSRTAWLANLLSTQRTLCLHEALIGCASMADLARKFNAIDADVAGSAETGFGLVAPRIVRAFPDARYVVIVREAEGFTEQTLRMGLGATPEGIHLQLTEFSATVEMLHDLGEQTMIVRPRQLDDFDSCQAIWEHIGCTTPLHRQRFEMLRDLKVEVFNDRLKAKTAAHMGELKELINGGA